MSESRKSTTRKKATVMVSDMHKLPEYNLPTEAYPQSHEDVQEELILSRKKHLQFNGMKIYRRKEHEVVGRADYNASSYMSPNTTLNPKGGAVLDMDFFHYYIVHERTIVGRYNDIESALRHLSLFGNNSRNRFTRRALIPVFGESPSHPYSLLSKGFISQFLHKKNNTSLRVKQTITNADEVRNAILKSLSCCYWETEKELTMMTRVVEKEHKILFPAIHSTSSMRLKNIQRRSGIERSVNDIIIDLPTSDKTKKERFAGQMFREALKRKTVQVYQEASVVSRAMAGRGNLHIISDIEDE